VNAVVPALYAMIGPEGHREAELRAEDGIGVERAQHGPDGGQLVEAVEADALIGGEYRHVGDGHVHEHHVASLYFPRCAAVPAHCRIEVDLQGFGTAHQSLISIETRNTVYKLQIQHYYASHHRVRLKHM
jgi:hypothetical protein